VGCDLSRSDIVRLFSFSHPSSYYQFPSGMDVRLSRQPRRAMLKIWGYMFI
jgi:hypothetical protein